MAKSLEKAGKTVEEAFQAALVELGLEPEDAYYEVLEEPSKGFLGFGAKPARILVTVREVSPVDKARKFLNDIFAAMKIDVTLRLDETSEGAVFNLLGENLGILIGKHGQTLDALQYLTNLAANRGLLEERVRVVLDVEGYRSRREETLRRLATRLAERAERCGDDIRLEPMNRHERKVIHLALQDHYRVTTYSDGEEPHRHVVISPKHRKRHDK